MIILILIISFLIGAVPTSYLLVKAATGRDIRQMGSGNVGATNVYRCVSKALGLAVLVLDAVKGYLPVYCVMHFYHDLTAVNYLYSQIVVGFCAILGHVFTPFLKWRGGKGVATSAGVGLAIFLKPMIAALICWLIILYCFRIMSIASMAASLVFSLLIVIGTYPISVKFLVVSLAAFLIWTHRSNIHRLMNGRENKL